MIPDQSNLPVAVAETIVDAVNRAVELEGGSEARIALLLQTLQRLMRRDARCALWVLDELDRDPAPRILSRTLAFPSNSSESPGSLESAQRSFDQAAPVTRRMLREAITFIRTPSTRILSQASAPDWSGDSYVREYLASTQTIDVVISMWSSSPDHAIFLVVHRRAADPPFTAADATLASLMLRAAAPFADRTLARRAELAVHSDLSPREREILLLLLAGDSEKQIAAGLSRSINTVHTFVRQIYRRFNVSSRGELMAKFVDQAVLESLRETDRP